MGTGGSQQVVGYGRGYVHAIRECNQFSLECLAFPPQSLDLLGDGEESTPAPEDMRLQTTPGLTTVVVPPAPRTQELTAAQQKKNRDREYQRHKRAMRRSAGTVSDEDSQSTGTGRRPMKRVRIADDDWSRCGVSIYQ
jgi:hypothetical protein